MLGDRPVYRFAGGSRWTTVLADTGEHLDGLTADEAMALARRFMPEHASTIRYDSHLPDSDQWTLLTSVRNLMPLHRIALGDGDHTYLYISDATGEAVMKSTGSERRWAYLGAIPALGWDFTPIQEPAGFLGPADRLAPRLPAASCACRVWRGVSGGTRRSAGIASRACARTLPTPG